MSKVQLEPNESVLYKEKSIFPWNNFLVTNQRILYKGREIEFDNIRSCTKALFLKIELIVFLVFALIVPLIGLLQFFLLLIFFILHILLSLFGDVRHLIIFYGNDEKITLRGHHSKRRDIINAINRGYRLNSNSQRKILQKII